MHQKKELKRGVMHGVFILILLSIVIFASWHSSPTITGFAVYDQDAAKAKIEQALSSSAFFNQVNNADLCILIQDGETAHVFNVVKDFTGLTVLSSEGFCKGLYSEDLVIKFNDYDSFTDVFDSFTPANIIAGKAGADYYILESKFVRAGGDVDCVDEFAIKYCDALNQISTPEQLIEGDMSCCIPELTAAQKNLLKQHLAQTGFEDETAARTESPMQILSGNMFNIIIYIVFGALIIVVLLVFVLKRKPKKEEKQALQPSEMQTAPAEDPRIAQLKQYIMSTEQQGYSREQIYDTLLDQGWQKEVLDHVFSQVR